MHTVGRRVSRRAKEIAGFLALAVMTALIADSSMAVPAVPDRPEVALLPGGARAVASGALGDIPSRPCQPESEYEFNPRFGGSGYGDACRRLRFAFGPIEVRPGQNDSLFQPLTAPRPLTEGQIVRFKADVVEVGGMPADGPAAPENAIAHGPVHLHHAVWLSHAFNYEQRYVRLAPGFPPLPGAPILASGEERTVIAFPAGYGLPVVADEGWTLLYMLQNMSTQARQVFITYDLDFVEQDDAKQLGIVPVKPIWLDVQRQPVHPDAPDTYANPVFNVQRGFGHYDERTGRRVCSWPRENCARHDPYGGVTPQQGRTTDADGQPIKVRGADFLVTGIHEGTLVLVGGHLHRGGVRNEVSLVRAGVEKPIFFSDAVYWDPARPGAAGGPVGSPDYAMTGTGAGLDWKVKIRSGDILRLNATYDSDRASWYSGMGIVMAFVATADPHLPTGVDVFVDDVALDPDVPAGAVVPPGMAASCRPRLTGPALRLCLRGQVTHGPATGHHHPQHVESASPKRELPAGAQPGPRSSEILMQAFTFGSADRRVADAAGVPEVEVGQTLRFVNLDTSTRVWHTITRCASPCDDPDPLADGGSGDPGDTMDFDSGEIGYGLFFQSAKGQLGWGPPTAEAVRAGAVFELTPTTPGTYTFFCRIHPWMRGLFRAVESAAP